MIQQMGSSTKLFSKLIIKKKQKQKKKTTPTKWGIRLFVLADSDTGYVHCIIPN
jgi:hypothetical protein